jgi:hypothetical protein
MGYKSPIHPLDLPDFRGETDEDSLRVKVVAPNVREGATINDGRATITLPDGTERQETGEEYSRRAMRFLVPKIRYWNLEEEDGTPIPIPRDIAFPPEASEDERLDLMVAHLYEQDENVVLAIYHEWRMVGMPKKADTDEGKDSETPSIDGPGASPNNDAWDIRELESQIPM